jgi:hypothetical protein
MIEKCSTVSKEENCVHVFVLIFYAICDLTDVAVYKERCERVVKASGV